MRRIVWGTLGVAVAVGAVLLIVRGIRGEDTVAVAAAMPGASDPASQAARLSPQALYTAQQLAGRSMSAPGTAQAVEADFEIVAAVAWPGEQVFGHAQASYHGHRILVVQVTQNVAGYMRQAPPRPGVRQTPRRLGGVQHFYDETLGQDISVTTWEAGRTAPSELNRIGPIVTFQVPSTAIPNPTR